MNRPVSVMLVGALLLALPALAVADDSAGFQRMAPVVRSLVRVHLDQAADLETVMGLPNLDIAAARKGQWIDLVIDPARVDGLRTLDLRVTVRLPDMELDMYEQMGDARIDFGDYHTYAEMVAELDALHAEFPQLTSERISIGTSWEGRDLWVMKVSDNPAFDDATEPDVFYNGVTHAREPIGCTLCLALIRYLCENYGSDPQVTGLVDGTEAWFLPVINPDGYVHNETTGGMWRKNRRDDGGSIGVDLNRNWGFKWGFNNSGSSPYPSADDYRGPAPFSEPETRAVRDFMIEREFVLSWDCHSYSNLFLYPVGYSRIYTPEHGHYTDLAAGYTQHNGYTAGTAWELLYPVNGGSFDWSYGDQISKPRCFGVSPEVGESFWQDSQIPNHIAENIPAMLFLLEWAMNDAPPTFESVDVSLACSPKSGVLPFTTQFTVGVDNLLPGTERRAGLVMAVTTGNGTTIPDWKTGAVTLGAGGSFNRTFNQVIPNHAAAVGQNTFTFTAYDVTPAPYNQPPNLPSGDGAGASCTVTGVTSE